MPWLVEMHLGCRPDKCTRQARADTQGGWACSADSCCIMGICKHAWVAFWIAGLQVMQTGVEVGWGLGG